MIPARLDLPDADIRFYSDLFSPEESDAFFRDLAENIRWEHERITIYGKTMDVPRQVAWYGDSGKSYRYSGVHHDPEPWTPTLLAIKERIEPLSGVVFNSVLLNHYRGERDSVGWHSDDERELGQDPVIGSVSLGATRAFQFRHKRDKNQKHAIDLTHGSYLLMAGPTQHHWLHQVPKSTRPHGPRINLTFRVIDSDR